jgi:HAD superfamily hydrolase (TIGR01459 family)
MTQTFVLPPGSGLSALAAQYDVIFSDVWGVLHNGATAWPTASDALVKFRQQGGTVVLLSNAPRPSSVVVAQLDRVGVPRTAWDGIVTSGDVTRMELDRRGITRLYHLGPPRDVEMFDGLELVAADKAKIAVVTGLDDDYTETPDDYRERMEALSKLDIELICANPDRVVERGGEMVWCAGALADLYEEYGGHVLHIGKPFPGVYEEALRKALKLRGKVTPKARVLAIGDSMITDVAGANTFGIDCLFMTGGIHAEEIGHPPQASAYQSVLSGAAVKPVGWSHRLVWDAS